jgi:hypothetical protein
MKVHVNTCPGEWRFERFFRSALGAWVVAFAAFVVIRLAVTAVLYTAVGGREFSSDCRFYVYLADHPWAVLTGENLRGPDFDKTVLTNYGPLLGLVMGGPLSLLRKALPDFLAVRVYLVVFEGLGWAWGCWLVARSRLDLGRRGAVDSAAGFALVAAVLPLGWVSTAAWAQDEILLAPFLFAGFIYAWRDKPWASALWLCAGAWVAKYFALAFLPAAWLVCRHRREFLAAVGFGVAPLAAYVVYMRAAYGIIPFVGYDTGHAASFALSVFTIPAFVREWGSSAGVDAWVAPVSKAIFLGVAAALIGVFGRRGAPRVDIARAARMWVAFGAAYLLLNIMGQPEYLAWFAYLGPLALLVLARKRALVWSAAGLVVLTSVAWLWNAAAGVHRWTTATNASIYGGWARITVNPWEVSAARGFEVGAAVVYVALLTSLLITALRPEWPSRRAGLSAAIMSMENVRKVSL